MKEVGVKFKPDIGDVVEAAESLGDKISGSMVASVAKTLSLTAAFGLLVSQIRAGMEAAKEHQLAELKLSNALKARGDATGQVAARLHELNAELAVKKGLDETELTTLQRNLALHGVRNEALASATRMTIGLAKVTGQDLQTAAVSVARVLEGHVTQLARVGISVKNAGDAITKLTELSKESSGEFGTTTGQLKLLSAEWARFRRDAFESKEDPKKTFAYRAVFELRTLLASLRQDVPGTLKDLAKILLPGGSIVEGALGIAKRGNTRTLVRTSLDAGVEKDEDAAAKKQAKDSTAAEDAKARAKANKEAIALLMKHDRERDQEESRWTAQQRARIEEERKIGMERLKNEEELAKKQVETMQDRNDYAAKLDDDRFETEIATLGFRQQEVLRRRRAGISDEIKLEKDYNQTIEDLQANAAQMSVEGVGNTMVGLVKAFAEGKKNIGDVLASMVGDTIVRIGEMLIQLGTAGVLAGTLGTFIPVLAALTGGPLGVAAGLAAIVGGAAMVGLGSGLGATVTGEPSPGIPSIPSGGTSRGIDQSFGGPGTTPGSQQPTSTTLIVHFDRGVIASDPRQFARQLSDYLKRGGGLVPGWAS